MSKTGLLTPEQIRIRELTMLLRRALRALKYHELAPDLREQTRAYLEKHHKATAALRSED